MPSNVRIRHAAIGRLSRWFTGLLENGSLQRYLALMLVASLAVVTVALGPLSSLQGPLPEARWTAVTGLSMGMLRLMALTVVFHRSAWWPC
jgi:multicomponent K+:H+ antiporter subunit A